jgi:hypothetical protein
MIMWYVILVVLWVIGALVSYKMFISKWDNTIVEKVYFSIIWPIVLILYGIYRLHKIEW